MSTPINPKTGNPFTKRLPKRRMKQSAKVQAQRSLKLYTQKALGSIKNSRQLNARSLGHSPLNPMAWVLDARKSFSDWRIYRNTLKTARAREKLQALKRPRKMSKAKRP